MIRLLLCFICLGVTEAYASGNSAAHRRHQDNVINLLLYGARPNDRANDSRAAFQRALSELQSAGGGVLSIPAGDYYLDFPDVASDLDPRDLRNFPVLKTKDLKREKLILVPPRVLVQGTVDKLGHPATRIHWKETGFPLLSFIHSDGSGIENIGFVFDGVQPQFFPWSQEQFSQVIGYKSRWIGGPYELSTVIYTIGSDFLQFKDLFFESSKLTADNEHTFAFGIVSKGKTPVTQPETMNINALPIGARIPGGGLSDCVSGNKFQSLEFHDYVMGILASGQCDAVFEKIGGDRRGSWYRSFDPSHESGPGVKNIGPPGHLIYLTFQNAYDVERTQETPTGRMVFHSTTANQNVRLSNINEGSHTLSNVNSLGTLALKDIQKGMVTGVVSQHPMGLIQTMVDAHDIELTNLRWTSNRDLCKEVPSRTDCGIAVIGLEPGPAESDRQFNSAVHFRNVYLEDPNRPAVFRVSEESGQAPLSNGITVDELTIKVNPVSAALGGAPAIITLRSASTHLTNVRYLPLIASTTVQDPEKYALIIQSRSSDTTAKVTIMSTSNDTDRPAYKCIIQDQHGQASGSKNEVDCHVVKQ